MSSEKNRGSSWSYHGNHRTAPGITGVSDSEPSQLWQRTPEMCNSQNIWAPARCLKTTPSDRWMGQVWLLAPETTGALVPVVVPVLCLR